jgi:hypothetical protein
MHVRVPCTRPRSPQLCVARAGNQEALPFTPQILTIIVRFAELSRQYLVRKGPASLDSYTVRSRCMPNLPFHRVDL